VYVCLKNVLVLAVVPDSGTTTADQYPAVECDTDTADVKGEYHMLFRIIQDFSPNYLIDEVST